MDYYFAVLMAFMAIDDLSIGEPENSLFYFVLFYFVFFYILFFYLFPF